MRLNAIAKAMAMQTLLSICISFVALRSVTAQYVANTEALIIKEIEHLYFDAAPAGMLSAITPCSNYYDPSTGASNNSLGRNTAAEWIRIAFHDFVTANIYSETGGIDASIGFETTRAENVGPAFNDALTFFSYFINDKVSMSDLIALGTVMAVGACGGPHIEMKGGRIDATAAGPSGVPEPETDLQDTLDDFSNAGFNTDDTITLTACGHSMGGVHHSSFPQAVPASAVSSTNTDGRIAFDETVSGFDIDTVNDYVHGTGDKGGPLVTTANKTVNSDFRLYNSDSNDTMTRLSASASYFAGQCSAILQRMIETVPQEVSLTTAVDPTATTNLRPYGIALSVNWKGTMTLTGYFRYIQISGAAAAPSTLPITLINRAGKTTTTSVTASVSSSDTGTGIWGPTHSYPFTLSFPASVGLSGLAASGQNFTFQDTMFAVTALSSVSPTLPTFAASPSINTVSTYSLNTTVAYLTSSPPTSLTATFAIPMAQTGSVSPYIDTSTTATLALIGQTTGGFALYSAVTKHSVSAKQAFGSSVDVAVSGQAAALQFYKPFDANQ
ncbi:hypothetical protein HO173_005835 [Letharia columbiana]|uniref:Peroxidase n=1 Tax=Letharia columbiana TaxID=112416 RepID=A0A8H6FWN2_9LECA|nr:uncharacterized protein HO173_005835 [Letharia columbiana]KAF6236205.1 hypothetical protein HO173_005835 [Letharia columbiana]